MYIHMSQLYIYIAHAPAVEVHIHSADSQGEQLEMTGWNWGEVAGEREGYIYRKEEIFLRLHRHTQRNCIWF